MRYYLNFALIGVALFFGIVITGTHADARQPHKSITQKNSKYMTRAEAKKWCIDIGAKDLESCIDEMEGMEK
jgi:hypothetical protein